MTFSSRYATFTAWHNAVKRTSAYAKRITRLHSLYPSATLRELREQQLVFNKQWTLLSTTQKATRADALSVAARMRRGSTLARATRAVGMSTRTAKRHLGTALVKRGNRWTIRADTIERGRWVYSNGHRVNIVVRNSDDASLLSQYLADVKQFLHDGNRARLHKYRNVTITDANGKAWPLETNPDVLRDLNERIEEPEFLPLYTR